MAEENAMSHGHSVSPKAEGNFRSAAAAAGDEYLTRGKEAWSDAARRLRDLRAETEQYVRQNPAKAVFTALAVGFVLALLRRR
jgi:ElaB/YqjD/DUF883 family membrane-anchored ribosome-binding protein